MLSIRLDLIFCAMAEGWLSLSLKTDSMTESSVEVVSCPVKAHQSFTTIPEIFNCHVYQYEIKNEYRREKWPNLTEHQEI